MDAYRMMYDKSSEGRRALNMEIGPQVRAIMHILRPVSWYIKYIRPFWDYSTCLAIVHIQLATLFNRQGPQRMVKMIAIRYFQSTFLLITSGLETPALYNNIR